MEDPLKILKPLVRSEYFASLERVLTDRKATVTAQMYKCEPEELKKLQGQVQELDYFLGLKAQLRADSKS